MIRDIALAHGDDPALAGVRSYQKDALAAIASCGTVAAGVHWQACDHCGDRRRVPNTCGHRSCPHCQARERAAWVEARTQELLPCGYFHIVMTMASEVRALASAFPAVVLGALMRAASDAVELVARNPRFLGAEVGQLAILHTWTRDLRWHPHVHLIVTAGGWDAQHGRWVDARVYGSQKRPFLVPVDVLRAAFQRRFRTLLLRAARAGDFGDGGGLPEAASPEALAAHLAHAMHRPWVIRIEPPFGGPHLLLKYLGAYVNRTAVSPGRVSYDAATATATLAYRSNAEPDRPQQTIMPAVDFLKLFVQHILPPRFQRIRFRGLWCTAHRAAKLEVARAALQASGRCLEIPPMLPRELKGDRCQVCGLGTYHRLPGPVRRPSRRDRGRLLRRIRAGEIHATHPEGTTAA